VKKILEILGGLLGFMFSLAILGGIGVGLYFLDGATGGHVFGPEGFVKRIFGSEAKTSFSCRLETGLSNYRFKVTNEMSEGDLSDFEATFTFVPAKGDSVEVKQTWASWKKDEEKEVTVRAGDFRRVKLEGTAKLGDKSVKLRSGWTWDEPIQHKVRGFASNFTYGPLQYQVRLTNKTPEGDLTDVEAQVTLIPASGDPVQLKPTWESWKKGEVKRLTAPADRYREVKLKGTAKVGGQVVALGSSWEWEKPHQPAVSDFRWDVNLKSNSALLTVKNDCPDGTLRSVEAKIQLVRSDGVKVTMEVTWDSWERGETKRLTVGCNEYRKATLIGKAILQGRDVLLDDSTGWTWK
jgi:hypothetical protein